MTDRKDYMYFRPEGSYALISWLLHFRFDWPVTACVDSWSGVSAARVNASTRIECDNSLNTGRIL